MSIATLHEPVRELWTTTGLFPSDVTIYAGEPFGPYMINFLQRLANSTTSDLDVHPERPNDYVYYLSGWRADGDSLADASLLYVFRRSAILHVKFERALFEIYDDDDDTHFLFSVFAF